MEWYPPRREEATHATYLTIAPALGPTIGFVGSRPAWAWGVEHGVNEAGVAVGNETIYTTLDPRGAPAGLIGIDLVRLALERSETAVEAVDVITRLLGRHGQGGSGHGEADRPYWSSFLVADAATAFVVETSGIEWMVEPVERTRAISNRTTIAAFDAAHRHPRQPVATLVDPRLAASNALLATEPVSVAALKDHSRSHVGGSGGWTVCMHVPDTEATTAALIAELSTARDPRRGSCSDRRARRCSYRCSSVTISANRLRASASPGSVRSTARRWTRSRPSSKPVRATIRRGTPKPGDA